MSPDQFSPFPNDSSNRAAPSQPISIDESKFQSFAKAFQNQVTHLTFKDFLQKEVHQELETVHQHWQQKDFKKIKFVCHHLLSTCGALGLLKLGQLCRKCEEHCGEILFQNPPSTALLAEIEACVTEMRKEGETISKLQSSTFLH